MIPVCDVKKQNESLQPQLDEAILGVVRDGQYVLGPNVKAFEKEFAAALKADYAVGVANGTDALILALRALDIGPGDEVITTPFTFIATAEAVSLVGGTPVFVDIDPKTFNLDPTLIEANITPRTKAVIPVHLFGQPCEMEPIMEVARRHNLKVIEDCAQATGATYRGKHIGTFGDIGCFSFFPSKNLGTMGDGGMVTTNDPALYERVEVLRRHGGRVRYYHDEIGVNSRLDELHAAILRVKLPHLEEWNTARRRNAYRYNEMLASVPGVQCPAELTNRSKSAPVDFSEASVSGDNGRMRAVYHQYTLLLEDRDAAIEHLKNDGVNAMIYYPVPLHRQKVYQALGYEPNSFPHTEAVAARCMSLPMFPELTFEQQKHIVGSLARFVAAKAGAKSLRKAA